MYHQSASPVRAWLPQKCAARWDRLPDDALVWAFSELLVEPMKGEGIYELYRQQAKAAAQPSQPQPAQTVPQPGSMEWLAEQEKLR